MAISGKKAFFTLAKSYTPAKCYATNTLHDVPCQEVENLFLAKFYFFLSKINNCNDFTIIEGLQSEFLFLHYPHSRM